MTTIPATSINEPASVSPNTVGSPDRADKGVRVAESRILLFLIGGTLVITTTLLQQVFGVGGTGSSSITELPAMVGALILALGLFAEAWREIKIGRPSNAVLASLAILAAYTNEMYETAGYVALVLLLFEQALRRTAWGAKRAIEQLVHLTPDTARLVNRDGSESEGKVSIVKEGDTVRVRAGEIIAGSTTINEASLTGEALPVEKSGGATVFAGTTNLTGQVDLRVTTVGADTTIGKVASLIGEAESARSDRQLMVEQVAAYFLPIVLTTAAIVWFMKTQAGDPDALETAIVILIVATPSALLISGPSAMVAAFAAAARMGVMIKETNYLEAAGNCDTIIFDKTGTLTTGKFAVSRLVPVEGIDGADLLRTATAAEQHSNHPIAASVCATAQQARIEVVPADESEEVHGKGVRVLHGGDEIRAGRAAWIVESGVPQHEVDAVEEKLGGITAVHVMAGGRYLGAVGLEDKLRRNAKSVVEQLRELDSRSIQVFTGDRFPVAKRVGQAVGVDRVEAECLPAEKHDLVRGLVGRGARVLMVGDGINDGPSLAAADVGVAMGLSGSDIATNSAGVALMNDDIGRVPFLVKLARKSRSVIVQNIAISIVLSITGLALAASGQLESIAGGLTAAVALAVLWHFVGDIVVLANSFRLFRFGEEYAAVEQAEARAEAMRASDPGPRKASAAIAGA